MLTYFKDLLKRIAEAYAACAAQIRAQWKRWSGSMNPDEYEAVETISTAVKNITVTKDRVMNELKRLLTVRNMTLYHEEEQESGGMPSPAAALQEDIDYMNSTEMKNKFKEARKQEILRQVNGATADCMDVITIGWDYDACITMEEYMYFERLEHGYRDLLEVYLDEIQALQSAAETLIGYDEICNTENP